MGSCFSTEERVTPANESQTELHNASKVTNGGSDYTGPVKDRSMTDVLFLVIMALFVLTLAALLGYCGYYGNIYRIVNGFDNCGNVCGSTNRREEDPRLSCKGKDLTSRPLLQIKEASRAILNEANINRECVDRCDPEFREFFGRCIPIITTNQRNENSFFSKTGLHDFIQEASEDLNRCWREILYLCLIALIFSSVILLMFRFMVGLVVWLVLIGVILVSIIGTVFLWILWKQKIDENYYQMNDKSMHQRIASSYLAYAIVSTLVTVIILLILLVMRIRIQLVIQLFKEAGKAVHSMPLLLFEPFITFLALGVVITLGVVFSFLIESSGVLTAPEGAGPSNYEKDWAMKFTRWYNLLGLFWFSQFVIGCQHMVIAGAVATWFFTRNKSNIDSPIQQSFSNLVTYHLGSVALGSLLIAIVQLARVLLKAIQYQVQGHENPVSRCLFRACQCCLACFEKFLQYLTRNAYIEIAMFGHSFCTAGQQAFKLLSSNALRVIAINSVGDFVLFMGKALVVIATVLIGIEIFANMEGINHVWVPLTIAGIFAYLVTHCFLTVYEMAIDTIFLCFCEDCEQNDGVNRPYYMSRGLMEFVQNSKKALHILDTNNVDTRAWVTDSGHTRTMPEGVQ